MSSSAVVTLHTRNNSKSFHKTLNEVSQLSQPSKETQLHIGKWLK